MLYSVQVHIKFYLQRIEDNLLNVYMRIIVLTRHTVRGI